MTSPGVLDRLPQRAPQGVLVEWAAPQLERAYRDAAPPRRPRRVVRGWSRRSHAPTAWASALGLALGALLFAYGVQHAKVRVILEGVSLAVIMGLLLDRVAPRLRNRTEVTLSDDALHVRHLPADEGAPTRLLRGEILAFEVEAVCEPLAARTRTGYQVNAVLTEGRVEPVFLAVEARDEAEWLRGFLADHALPPPGRAS